MRRRRPTTVTDDGDRQRQRRQRDPNYVEEIMWLSTHVKGEDWVVKRAEIRLQGEDLVVKRAEIRRGKIG